MRVAGNRLEMMLDGAGIPADKIVRQVFDCFEYEAVMRPESGLPCAHQAFVRVDADKETIID